MSDGTPLHDLSIAEAGKRLRAGRLTSRALTEHSLGRIEKLDPKLNAFLLVTTERALSDADRADRELRAGTDKGPLHGIPYALKDIYATAGIRTTCHSKLLLDHIPREDCVAEQKFRAGGGVLLGKLATHEFATGGPCFDLPFPPARNPWHTDHFTGGSSSGSGAAVAAGITRMAMGSDTGGSIRGPAFYCGTVGLKPTYGLVSRRGVFPLSYTLDHVGPLTWSVEDTALTMQVLAGHDPQDPASANVAPLDFTGGLNDGVSGLRLAYPRSFFAGAPNVDAELVASLDAAAQTLSRLGATIEEVSLPPFELFNACGQIIMRAEAFAVHEENIKSRPLDYAHYTYQRIAPGALLSAADLTQAFRLRRELSDIVNNDILGRCHALFTATALRPAPRLDAFGPDAPLGVSTHTIPFNVTGNPALSVPTGFTKSGLPLGMQIVGRAFDDPAVLRIGAAFEKATGLSAKRPEMAA